jgi:DNA-binding IclR family transcriptional regulator
MPPGRRLSHGHDMARSRSGESVLQRAVRILEVFGPDSPSVSIGDIAKRADLPLSTASRLVEEMIQHGLLRRDSARRVRIGIRLWELASRAAPTRGLRDAAMPFMEDLHAVVGHHVQLAVREGVEVLIVERLSAPGAVVNVSRIAGRLPAHVSSSGLVLLSHAPTAVQARVLAGLLVAMTGHTITDSRTLRTFMAEVRRTGVAYCPRFIHPDATGIAVPIRDPGDQVIAALSVIVPADKHAASRIPALQTAAHGIRRSLGMPWPKTQEPRSH